ncbi:hypothetical protein SFRURICE_002540 [Spodoptera frugiperda]|nr:hypothetical protein SFRURICE_002540 [Spodoptera frugiperda]
MNPAWIPHRNKPEDIIRGEDLRNSAREMITKPVGQSILEDRISPAIHKKPARTHVQRDVFTRRVDTHYGATVHS